MIRTKGYQGEIRKGARIFTNDPLRKIETVEIKAFVKMPVSISPRSVYLSGPADRGVSMTVTVKAGEKRPLTIEESGFDLAGKVTYAIEEVEAGSFFRIRFTTIPGPPGTFRGILRLKTNYPERPQIDIPVMTILRGVAKQP
jgi:hypothetical protein